MHVAFTWETVDSDNISTLDGGVHFRKLFQGQAREIQLRNDLNLHAITVQVVKHQLATTGSLAHNPPCQQLNRVFQ